MGALHAGHRAADPRGAGHAEHGGRGVDLREPVAVRAERGPRQATRARSSPMWTSAARSASAWSSRPSVEDMYPAGRAGHRRTPARSATSWRARRGPATSPACSPSWRSCSTSCSPTYAVFGEKDYQQLLLIHRMVRDLNFPLRRRRRADRARADGLALSSRNAYLTRGAAARRRRAVRRADRRRARQRAGRGRGAQGRARRAGRDARGRRWTTWSCAARTSVPRRRTATPGCSSPPGSAPPA